MTTSSFKICLLFFGVFFLQTPWFYAQEQDAIEEAEKEIDSLTVTDDFQIEIKPLKDIEKKIKPNSEPISITNFEDISKKYASDDFDYQESSDNSWDRFITNLSRFLRDIAEFIFGKQSVDRDNVEKFIKTVFFLVALVIIIRLIIKHKGRWFFDRADKKIDIPIEEIEQRIHEVDFQKMIQHSESQNDTRQSIRLHYLWLLKTLSDRKIIEWNVRKTNSDYAREIKNEQQKADFINLSKIYNYIWYGEFTINDAQYKQAKQHFKNYITTQKIK